MQVTALVLAGAMTLFGATAAGVPPEQLGQMPAKAVVVEEEIITGGAIVEEQKPPKETEKVEKPSSEVKYTVVLGEYTTKFSTANSNRCSNIKLAAAAMNGYIVEPGQTFSFNIVVGKRSTAKGYKTAPIISNGEYIDGVGGGICQVSTTLFNAALLGNMKIKERWAHSLKSSYVPAGRDATVSYGGADFKFINPYSQPVKVVTVYNSNGSIKASIMGPEGSTKPWVQLKVTGGPKKYILTRIYGGNVNYAASSSYR